jgi:hypothetical protein
MENKILIFIAVLFVFILFSCKKTVLEQQDKTSLLEIQLEKCTILYSPDVIWGYSPNKMHIETTIISQSTDTMRFVASGKRFREPILKSQIVSIINQDTIRLHPSFWSDTYIIPTINPKDSIKQVFTYNTSDYMDNFFLGKRNKLAQALKVDKILIKELLNQDLVYIINKADYENYALPTGRKIEDFPLPKVYFTKSKDFEILVNTEDFY